MTIDKICEEIEIPKVLAEFQDTYNPIKFYCAIRRIIPDFDYKNLKEYQKIYDTLMLEVKNKEFIY